jgi:choline dehydrogenase
MVEPEYDVVIVGGGSAGCVLANRLSTDPGCRVLLLEAGGVEHAWDLQVQLPLAIGRTLGKPRYDWNYTSAPEPHLRGRTLRHPRGRLLGGSSSINGMIYQRGHRADFDAWAAAAGAPGWDYAHCLPYFARLENSLGGPPEDERGHGGPQTLQRSPAEGPLFAALFAAARQAGHAVRPDANDDVQEGFAPADQAVRRGLRESAARAYLHPVRRRPNLEVRVHAPVHRVLFSGTRAVGVAHGAPDGHERTVRAAEVVLAGGAVGSPHVLQLSGVGDADHLRSVGLPVVHHLPGVGADLQDHLAVHLQHTLTLPVSMADLRRKARWPQIVAEALLLGRGPGALNPLQAVAFLRSSDRQTHPDLLLGLIPLLTTDAERRVPLDEHGFQLYMGVMRSNARGHVRATSADPARHPEIRLNYLADDEDRQRWLDGVRIGRDLLSQPAFASLGGREITPGPAVRTDAEVLDWVARTAFSGLHLAGSARMGRDDRAVVDPDTLRVHGLDGLRVVDASIMPVITNGNTYAPTMMLAEKAADIVLGRPPLPPATRVRPHLVPAPDPVPQG